MLAGVTIVDPRRRGSTPTVELEPDSPSIRSRRCAARHASPTGAEIGPHAVAIDAEIGPEAIAGPFCYLRPGTVLAAARRRERSWRSRTRAIGEGTKVPHLSYIGDADIGDDTNIAAGAITANFPHEPGRPSSGRRSGATSGPASTMRSSLRSRSATTLGSRRDRSSPRTSRPARSAIARGATGEQRGLWRGCATTEPCAARTGGRPTSVTRAGAGALDRARPAEAADGLLRPLAPGARRSGSPSTSTSSSARSS